jgi:hypothetical protein
MACELLLWDVVLLCCGHVELIVVVQAQHISNRKYSNTYTINDECRQTIGCIDIAL